MAILIAGCGYVGSALARRLLARGEAVIGLRRDPTKLPPGVEPVGADLGDADALRDALGPLASRVDRLVYAASADERTPAAYRRAYVDGLDHVLRALRDAPPRRVVYTASTAVYGQSEGWVDEDSPTEPSAFTGRILLEGEARLREAEAETVSLRLAGIYGPGRTRLVSRVEGGDVGPNRFTNRIHRDDCAGAIDALLREDAPASVYVGVDDAPAPLAEVSRFIAAELGCPAPTCDGPPTGKRCRNARLRAIYEPIYPTYREGYAAMLAERRRTRAQRS